MRNPNKIYNVETINHYSNRLFANVFSQLKEKETTIYNKTTIDIIRNAAGNLGASMATQSDLDAFTFQPTLKCISLF